MIKKILYISEVGKKVSFVKGNRNVDRKNLKQKKTSIVECGQLVPIIIINSEEAIAEGLTIVDCETGVEVPQSEAQNYVVIVEGQHRYKAIKELQDEDKKKFTHVAPEDVIVMYAQNGKSKSVKKLISELNRTSVNWDGKDYVTGAALCNPTNELLKYAKELADLRSEVRGDGLPTNGYPISTISKLTSFGPKLTIKALTESMEKGTDGLPTANIERAKRVIDSALRVGFDHKYLSHKYFIDWFIDEWQLEENLIDVVCGKVQRLSKLQVDEILKIKSENYIFEIRRIINAEVNAALPELKSA